MAKGDSMYDHARSEKDGGGGKKVTETKKVTEEKAPDKGDGGVGEMLSGFKKLLAQHEAERRDHHNNHREALRQMGNRHAKALKDHFDLAAPKMDAGGADAAPEAAGQVPAGTPGQQA